MWRDHPLLGIGPGTFMHEFETYRPIEAIEGDLHIPSPLLTIFSWDC